MSGREEEKRIGVTAMMMMMMMTIWNTRARPTAARAAAREFGMLSLQPDKGGLSG